MTKQQSIIARILGNTTNPAAEVEQAIKAANARQREITARLEAITTLDPMTGQPGPVRSETLLTGTPAEVVALDDEHRNLRAEAQQLTAQLTELQRRLEHARADQAKQDLPGAIKAVEPALKAHHEAQARAEQAKAQLKAAVEGVTNGRTLVGDDAPAIAHALALEVADALDLPERDAPDRYNAGRAHMVQRLSGALPEKARDDYDPRPEKPDLSKPDRTDLRRQPEQSIWDRKEPGRAA